MNSPRGRYSGGNDIGTIVSRSERRAILLSVIVPALASGIIFFNEYQQKRKVASYFSEILRYEIIRGSMRDAVFQSQRMIIQDGPFFRLQYRDFDSKVVIDQSGADAEPFLKISIDFPLTYGNFQDSKSAGTLTYYYSLESFLVLSLLLLLLSLVVVIVYLRKQRKFIVKRIEEEVRLQKNEAIARTINNLAHDLRAPLNMMEIFIHQRSKSDDQDYRSAKQGLLRIQAMIESLKHTEIDQFVRVVRTRLDANYIIQLLSNMAVHQGKSLSFEGSFDVVLNIDQPKMERVIQNLAVNAIEAAKSKIIIEFKFCNNAFQIICKDDGPGVPSDILPMLFQRGITFGKQGGTGLGLSYCKTVVEGHGGTLQHQRIDSWTYFIVDLPLQTNTLCVADPSDDDLTRGDIFIALVLENKVRQKELFEILKREFTEYIILVGVQSAHQASVVFIDNLDVMVELTNQWTQSVIFVRPDDRVETLIKKLKILVKS